MWAYDTTLEWYDLFERDFLYHRPVHTLEMSTNYKNKDPIQNQKFESDRIKPI